MYSQKRVQEAQEALERKLGFPLVRYSFSEVATWEERLRGAFSSEGTPLRALHEEEEEFISNEILLCKIDFRYWAERYCYISSSEGRLVPLRFIPSQEKLLRKIGELEESRYPLPVGKVCVIVPKARRVGATVFGQAAMAHGYLLRPHCAAMTASDVPESTLKLYNDQLRIYNNLPLWMRPRLDGKVKADHLNLPDLDSKLMFGTGNQKNPLGQGDRIDFFHTTETSTWVPDAVGMLDADVLPAFLSSQAWATLAIIESTGKGGEGNWFYQQCMTAAQGRSFYRTVFLSWYDRPDLHTMDPEGVVIPEDVQRLGQRLEKEQGVTITKGQLAWYATVRLHHEAKNDLDTFHQEYPTTLEDCFRMGLKSVFPITLRDSLRMKAKPAKSYGWVDPDSGLIKWYEERPEFLNGYLVVWEGEDSAYYHVVAVDASHGLGRDRHCVEVLRKGLNGAPDEQVAQYWSDTISPFQLANVVEKIARLYGADYPATTIIESNPGNPGQITQQELIRRGFPSLYINKRFGAVAAKKGNSYGFPTTPSTRNIVTACLEDNILHEMVVLNSPFTFGEMDHYVETWSESGRRHHGHAEGKDFHDDSLMALGLALLAAHENEAHWMAEERRQLALEKKLELERPPEIPYHMRSDLLTMDDVWAAFYEKAERTGAWN